MDLDVADVDELYKLIHDLDQEGDDRMEIYTIRYQSTTRTIYSNPYIRCMPYTCSVRISLALYIHTSVGIRLVL